MAFLQTPSNITIAFGFHQNKCLFSVRLSDLQGSSGKLKEMGLCLNVSVKKIL